MIRVYLTRRSIYAVRDRWLILRIVAAILGVLFLIGALAMLLA